MTVRACGWQAAAGGPGVNRVYANSMTVAAASAPAMIWNATFAGGIKVVSRRLRTGPEPSR